MKKALSLIIIAALLLCGCADKVETAPEVTPGITSGADSESTIAQDTEANVSSDVTEEAVTDDMEWHDSYPQYYLDPLKEAKSQEIKELLGIESMNDVYFADCARSGDYMLKSYYISDLHLVAYTIGTNCPQDFNVEITATQINPDTGEEKKIEASTSGNLSAKLVARADEGYVIKSYVITNDFISRPLRIEKEFTDEQIENGFLKERFSQIDESEHEKYLQDYYSQKCSGQRWEDYSNQIIEGTTWYTLDGRASIYPIALGEHHDHSYCDSTDAELMALGRERLAAAVKIDTLINGHAMRDLSNELPVEGWDEGYYALSKDFGDYESIMELYKNPFSPDVGLHDGYYSKDKPDELLEDYHSIGTINESGEVVQAKNLSVALELSMIVHDGVTYETGTGLCDTHTVETRLCGVLSHTDTHIEYGLCTMVFDEEGEILMDELGIHYDRPQVCYAHTIMKLDLIDGQWLITQIRDELEQYTDFIDEYGYEF